MIFGMNNFFANMKIATYLLLLVSAALFAQNGEMKARIAFEDAETAFESRNYQEALNHLEEAGNALGKPSLKIEFLQILTLDKLVQQENYSYKHLADLRRLAKSYLDKSTDPDKYREVNNIVKRIADYPKNPAEYNASIQRRKAEEEMFLKKVTPVLDFGREWCSKYHFKPNLKSGNFVSENPLIRAYPSKKLDGGTWGGVHLTSLLERYSSMSIDCNEGTNGFMVDDNDVVVYYPYSVGCGKRQLQNYSAQFNEIRKFIHDNIDKEYFEEKENEMHIMVAVPESLEQPKQISYYITFVVDTKGNKDFFEVRFSTIQRLASY